MLVYIHVPFCRSRCKYCAFYSVALGRNLTAHFQPLRDYVTTLLLEIAYWGEKFKGKQVSSIFFGGGTPSLVSPEDVGKILEQLARFFTLDANAEITLEANPESLQGKKIVRDFLQIGINRLSIGIQSLDADLLHLLGRTHKAEEAINAVLNAREVGFANIGVDLMWGLPGQSVRLWLQTLKTVSEQLKPNHISAYALTLEEGTPLAKKYAAGRLTLPPERDQSLMFMEGGSFLEARGYLHYEISNFARMGYECRHNLGYWEGQDYLGCGPSATSTIEKVRWTNAADLTLWAEQVHKGTLAEKTEELTPLIQVLELLMLNLRTSRGLRLKAYKDLTGRDFLTDQQNLVQTLYEHKLIRIRDGYLRLTDNGMLVSNSILSNLFERTKNLLTTQILPTH